MIKIEIYLIKVATKCGKYIVTYRGFARLKIRFASGTIYGIFKDQNQFLILIKFHSVLLWCRLKQLMLMAKCVKFTWRQRKLALYLICRLVYTSRSRAGLKSHWPQRLAMMMKHLCMRLSALDSWSIGSLICRWGLGTHSWFIRSNYLQLNIENSNKSQ